MYCICLGAVADWMSESLLHVNYSLESVQQVSRDWLVEPFVDIIVTDENYCPSSHPDLVFYRTFMGSNDGCDCMGIWDYWIYDGGNTYTNGLQCGRNETKHGCRQVKAIPPTIMGQVNGERVCGKRASYNFLTAVRPIQNGDTIRCPDGYTHCGDPGS